MARIYLGLRETYGERIPLALSDEERFRHLYVIGASGTGKTTLLRNLIGQELLAGEGCGLIDPHGELAEAALGLVPPGRTSDIALIDLAATDRPAAWNPLYRVPPEERALVHAAVRGGDISRFPFDRDPASAWSFGSKIKAAEIRSDGLSVEL